MDSVPTVEEVCVRLGCPQLRQNALEALSVYKKSFLGELAESRRDDVNFDRALYVCAAVGAAAKITKTPVNKQKLAAESGGESKAAVDRTIKVCLLIF